MAMPIADGIMFLFASRHAKSEYKKPREATDSYSIGLDCRILTPECFRRLPFRLLLLVGTSILEEKKVGLQIYNAM